MIFLRMLFLGVLLLSGFSSLALAVELTQEQKEIEAQKVGAAIQAAQTWVLIVDQGRYMESWHKAAEFFKDRIPDGQWETTMRQVRYPFGKVFSREVLNYQYSTRLPGVPDGEYVLIQFKTNFEKKNDAVETITSMIDPDGQWRVSGYYIK